MQLFGTPQEAGPQAVAPKGTDSVQFLERVPARDDKIRRSLSCKPAPLRVSRRPSRSSRRQTIVTEVINSSEKDKIDKAINGFLTQVSNEGFVVPADHSSIKGIIKEIEEHDHGLAPVAETADTYPGGFRRLNLTYLEPKVNLATKPAGFEGGRTASVMRERPSQVWAKLGSPVYYFVDGESLACR